MKLRPTISLALLTVAPILASCGGSKPQIDVQTTSTAPPAVTAPAAAADAGVAPSASGSDIAAAPAHGSAPPIAPDAQVPPNHPPMPAAGPLPANATIPPNHPPIGGMSGMGGMPGAMPPNAGVAVMPGGQGEKAVAWATPSGWVSEQPSNQMRRAQYKVPGAGGAAECVVFYFGPGQGGDPQANAQRWASQFVGADGAPSTSAMKTRNATVNGLKVLYVETKGTYMAGSMTGGQVEQKPNYALLGAVVEGPDANWFVKLTGPESTVNAQRGAFESMIGSMKKGG